MTEAVAVGWSAPAGNDDASADRTRGEVPAVTVTVAIPGAVQMRLLGARLARLLRSGDLVVLTGSLGTGKTTLVQGIGAGLAVRGPVTSPTFVIARMHPALHGGPDLVHADAYRLGSRLEVDDLDLDADLDHSVTVVEWGEDLVENLASGHLRITIDWPPAEPGASEQVRVVTMTGYGARWSAAAGQLRAVLAEPLQ